MQLYIPISDEKHVDNTNQYIKSLKLKNIHHHNYPTGQKIDVQKFLTNILDTNEHISMSVLLKFFHL